MMTDRWVAGRALRRVAADRAYSGQLPDHVSNGEETSYPYVANYSKGLPHNPDGQVVPSAYRLLLRAVSTGLPDDFERIPLGRAGGRKFTNPQAGLAFDVEGPDAQGLVAPPTPRIDGPRNSSEMAELYWMALARDVKFTDFAANPIVAKAAVDLTKNFTDFRGPKVDGSVTPATLFRGDTPGDLVGPYVSQFLLRDIPYGALSVKQLIGTVQPGVDYLTQFSAWLAAQNGANISPNLPGPPLRYIQTPRDLATYVHVDALYEAYLNACLILLGMGAPFDAGNPYNFSRNQTGFGTYGGPHILSLLTEVATRALKAVWFQKWFVHRRLRPEEFGGRIEARRLGLNTFPMINSEILHSPVLGDVLAKFGSHLLAQAFAEGCPTHPAYGSGHATVAGACVTILKAWFDESFVLPGPVLVPDMAGTALVPANPASPPLTVGGELNKLAANIGNARNMAGVHWRTDFTEFFTLGEALAIGILRDQKPTTNEDASLTITRFDGTTITI